MLVEMLPGNIWQTIRLMRIIVFGQYLVVERFGKVIGYSKRLCICKSCVCRSLPTRAERVLTACSPKRKGIIRKEL